MKAFI